MGGKDVKTKHLDTKRYLYPPSKLSCPKFEFLLKVKVMESNPGYLLKSSLLYHPDLRILCNKIPNESFIKPVELLHTSPYLMIIVKDQVKS